MNKTQYPAESKFLTELETIDLSGGRKRLIRPLVYLSKVIGGPLYIPAGFDSDECSVPRLPFLYAWIGNKFPRAGFVHDYLYRYARYNRKTCDSALYEAARVDGASRLQAFSLWFGVSNLSVPFYWLLGQKHPYGSGKID